MDGVELSVDAANAVGEPRRGSITSPTSSSSDTTQQHNVPTKCLAIFFCVDTLLLGGLQLVNQNKTESSVDTNPTQMKTFYVAVCIYMMLLGIKFGIAHRPPPPPPSAAAFHRLLGFVILASGSVSSAALLSIIFHGADLFWFALIIICILGYMAIQLFPQLLDSLANWADMVLSTIYSAAGRNHNHQDQLGSSNLDHTHVDGLECV